MKKKGFTLIELLAVVLILAIIALILIPVVNKIVESARDAANKRSVEGYIGDVNYALAEKTLVERTADGYDGDEVTDLSGLDYNDVLVCEFYTIKDGVVQYAEECTRKDGAWESFYNYGIGLGVWRSKVLGKKADIDSISIADVAATKDGDTFRVTVSGVRKTNISISSEEPITYVIKKNNIIVSNEVLTLKNGENTFEITATSENGKKTKTYTLIVTASNVPTTIEGESLLQIVKDEDLGPGTYTFLVNGQNYPIHMYVYDGNQNWTDSSIPIKNGFGDQYDVATSASTNATRMVIVKVNGNLTNSTTIRPYYNASYGGPKGFMLYVTGKLTNNGTIDNSHGAKAPGQNVYLWKNTDNSYVYVPSAGATGVTTGGAAGTNGTGRQTGSGGAGGKGYGTDPAKSGDGTSYSGGTGSGGNRNKGNGTAASNTGGAGGNGIHGAGGTGNPGGTGYFTNESGNTKPGTNGTGGLLIIYANEYENKGTIQALGTQGASGSEKDSNGLSNGGGGASGGGSINIFTNQSTNVTGLDALTQTRYNNIKGTTSVLGGAKSSTGGSKGGAGGNGTVNIGEIRNGQYYDLKTIIEQDVQSYIANNTITGDSIISILRDNTLNTGYYVFNVNSINYHVHLYNYNGDQTWTSTSIPEKNGFGASGDVATSATEAQNMVIVKVNGDLTNSTTIRPYYNATYGGPKGFILYVTGKLTNTGTIDNSHGAKATGENVYLWKNANGTYEYVPAVGAAGVSTGGAAGTAGTGRQTGAGGAGGKGYGSDPARSGNGTSYSGGAGSGGNRNTGNGTAASNIGGVGGTAKHGAGGTGNPGGTGYFTNESGNTRPGTNGTGGLLVISANECVNSNKIQALGTQGASGSEYDSNKLSNGGGGASGGGSINMFCNSISNSGTISAAGGAKSSTGGAKGGAGGAGRVNVGRIVNGSYVAN